ncbi:MAG TPA: efflux RND transporter periplasmic adaptor subunit [Bryobacteraceae bacterium]|nr:efflux RND transporter periplasmic adaptor subunit [Bryobacteraceae bacterium]
MLRIPMVVLVATAAFLAGCSGTDKKAEAASAPNKAAQPIAVQTVAAQGRQIDRTLSVTGSLEPDETVSVSSEVPGRVQTISVDFGNSVRKGQVIAQLDTQELALAVDRSKASLAQALARLGLDPGQESVRPESTPSIRQAQAQLDDASSKYENASRLVKTGDISSERFTEVQKSYEARKAVFEAARDDARTLTAQVQALQAEVRMAQKRLNDATLRAPFDGIVSAKLISPGQYIKENTPVVTLVKPWPLRLRVEVPETAAGTVRPGTTLTFSTDAAPEANFSASVHQLNPSLDAKSRTLTVEARLNRADPRLRPGMFVQVDLVIARGTEAVLVPKNAIYTVAGLNKLFTVRNGKAVEHRIDPGQELDGWVAVPRERVSPGDVVATSALTQLVDGSPVRASSPKS